MSNYIVPDYIIYDELKRERERERHIEAERPLLEIPRYLPHIPEMGFDSPNDDNHTAEDEVERGEVIIPMW
jgi:hypothetical protein